MIYSVITSFFVLLLVMLTDPRQYQRHTVDQPLTVPQVQELIGPMGIGLWPQDPGHNKLSLREGLLEHPNQRNPSAFPDRQVPLVEVGVGGLFDGAFEVGGVGRGTPAVGCSEIAEGDSGVVGDVGCEEGGDGVSGFLGVKGWRETDGKLEGAFASEDVAGFFDWREIGGAGDAEGRFPGSVDDGSERVVGDGG